MKNKPNISLKIIFVILLFGTSQSVISQSISPPSNASPNIVLVLADDMSWFDIGAYHQAIDYVPKNAITPNIDKLLKKA